MFLAHLFVSLLSSFRNSSYGREQKDWRKNSDTEKQPRACVPPKTSVWMIKLVLNIQAEFSALGVRNGHSYSCCNAFPHSISRNCKYLLVSWEHGDNFQFSERSIFCVPASCQECLAALLSLECPPSCAEAASSMYAMYATMCASMYVCRGFTMLPKACPMSVPQGLQSWGGG